MRQTKKQKHILDIYNGLYAIYGIQHCSLDHKNPYELMIATILSAQCTDARVNKTTPELFAKYPTPKAMANSDIKEVERIIHPLGFFRNKSKNIIACSQKIEEDFNGEVPNTMEDLVSLPGIGRKTANVILGDAFNVPGFPVDTHVKRLLNRLGVLSTDDPVKIEDYITRNIPDTYWTNFSHILIIHGRQCCHARSPKCEACTIAHLCNYYKKSTS